MKQHYSITSNIPQSIFRAYDIRSDADLLSDDVVYTIGHAIAIHLKEIKQDCCLVGRDARLSSPRLFAALVTALQEAAIEVIDLGLIPTPLLYFAIATGTVKSGIMITASHNPANCNGLKLVFAGQSPSAETIQQIYGKTQQLPFSSHAVNDKIVCQPLPRLKQQYIDHVTKLIQLQRPLKVVLDCSNGIAAAVAPDLLRALGCKVIVLNGDINGLFPNHSPDTSIPEAYQQLIAATKQEQADLGIMFDGDGDRVGVICHQGDIIWADRLLMLIAQEVLQRLPGSLIIYDVKSTQYLKQMIEAEGGKPLMCRTGHSFMKQVLYETQAPVAAEMSGHIFFNDRWLGFDDGIYAAARLLEVIARQDKSLYQLCAQLPQSVATPELLYSVPDEEKFTIVTALQEKATFPGAIEINKTDGIRVVYAEGWGLIRASNTSPNLTLRFEAESESSLQQIKQTMLSCLKQHTNSN